MRKKFKTEIRIVGLSILFGLVVFMADAVIDYYIFYEGSFWDLLILDVPRLKIYFRSIIMFFFILFGIIVSRLLKIHMRSENALRESEEKFRSVVINSQAIIFMIDKNGRFILSEGKALSSLGLMPGEAVGKSAFEMYKDFPEIIKGINKALNGSVYNDVIDVGGVTFDIFYSPHKDSEGKIIGAIGMAVDITETFKTQKALEESERKFRGYIESAPDGVLVVNKTGRFVEVNKSACRITGYSREELLKKSIPDILAPESREDGARNFNKVIAKGFASGELTFLRKDRSKGFLSINAVKISENRLLGFIKDITERKKAEELREELIADLQEAANKIKTLSGFIPICASCKKIRDDKGYWEQIEIYITSHSEAEFSHSICPECLKKLYPDLTD